MFRKLKAGWRDWCVVGKEPALRASFSHQCWNGIRVAPYGC